MDPNDLYAFLTANDPAAAAQAQAMAQQARRDQALGQLSAIVGGPFKGASETFGKDADQGQTLLNQGAMARQGRALSEQKLLVDMANHRAGLDAKAAEQAAAERRHQERMGLERQRLALGKEPKAPKPPDAGKMNLGEYLSPATGEMTDQQRNALLNELAMPGGQLLDQMSELHGLLNVVGNTPTVDQLKDIQRLVSSTLVKSNKVAGLGALSGPDLDLLTKAGGSVGELTNIFGQATGLRDLKKSVRNAAERWAKDIQIAAGTYGSSPVKGKALDFDTFDTRAEDYRRKWSGGGASSAPQRMQGTDGKWYVNDGKGWRPE